MTSKSFSTPPSLPSFMSLEHSVYLNISSPFPPLQSGKGGHCSPVGQSRPLSGLPSSRFSLTYLSSQQLPCKLLNAVMTSPLPCQAPCPQLWPPDFFNIMHSKTCLGNCNHPRFQQHILPNHYRASKH